MNGLSLIRYTEALSHIEAGVEAMEASVCSVTDALGKTLDERIAATMDSPPFDNSAVDGYAVRADDVRAASVEAGVDLTLLGVLYAGDTSSETIGPGQCCKIMTGAPVPAGADAVVMVEHAQASGSAVCIRRPVQPQENIRKQAAEFSAGDILLQPGVRIGPMERGVILSQGIREVKAISPARVSIRVTGDELVDAFDAPRAGQIRDVNSHTLSDRLLETGRTVVSAHWVCDTGDSLRDQFQEAFQSSDVVISTGGVSAGDKDLVRDELEAMGVDIRFHGVAVKPGKPILFGVHAETRSLVFGLPGNVVSAVMGFHLFVEPALRRLEGRSDWRNESWFVRCGTLLHNPGGRTAFVRARISHTPSGMPIAFPTGEQGSGMLTSMLGADGVIVVPADVDTVNEFTEIEFIPFR